MESYWNENGKRVLSLQNPTAKKLRASSYYRAPQESFPQKHYQRSLYLKSLYAREIGLYKEQLKSYTQCYHCGL